MYKDLDFLIEQFEARQNEYALSGAGAPNHDVYEQRLTDPNFPAFKAVPHMVYFYYVRVDNDGRLRVVHYRYVDGDINDPNTWQPIEYSEARLKPIVELLAKNARPGAPRPRNPEPDPDENFENIEWNRKSYVAIFIDEANWKFHKFPHQDSAVVFITEPKNGVTGTENHAFFDAMDFEITMPINDPNAPVAQFDERSAIVFINHMKRDERGTDLGHGLPPGETEEQFFQFKLFLDVAFATGSGVPMTVILDPGGTNMGPPVPPPA
jgi:hypothetical protein